MENSKKWLFFLISGIGVLLFFTLKNSHPEIPLKPALTKTKGVDVLTLKKEVIAPVITAFGRVEVKDTWQGVAQISAEIDYLHPQLEVGQYLSKGTELVRFNVIDSELAQQKKAADVLIKKAKLAAFEQEEKNQRAILVIEQESLVISKKEYQRQKNLKTKGLNSQSSLEKEQKAFLLQKIKVQELQNKLALMPTEKRILSAELDNALIALKQSLREIEKARVVLPFNARISRVDVVENEYVAAKQTLVSANGLAHFEVAAQISVADYFHLFSDYFTQTEKKKRAPFALNQISAKVILQTGSLTKTWPARLVRVSDTLTPDQGTLAVFLVIEQVLNQQTSGSNQQVFFPEIFNDMFVSIELKGKPALQWVIPEKALRGDKLYFFDEGKLRIEQVDVLFRLDDKVIIGGNFKEGAPLVITDLIPAVDGMGLSILTLDGKTQETHSLEKNTIKERIIEKKIREEKALLNAKGAEA